VRNTALSGPLIDLTLHKGQFLTALYIDHEWPRVRALADLAPHLPGFLLEGALESAKAIGGEEGRAQALAGLAPQLPIELQKEAARVRPMTPCFDAA
jgi:hypothetical protein